MTGATALRVGGPPRGTVEVWRVRLDAPDLPREALAATLDVREREHAARMRIRGCDWAAAHGARRVILASYLGVAPRTLRFSAPESGKPRLVDAPGLEFSFARTEGLAVLAVASDRAVGVDVERENDRTDIELVARGFLPPDELAVLEAAPLDQRRRAFFAAWTRHEARLKLCGQGLTGGTPECGSTTGTGVVARALALPSGLGGAIASAGGDWLVAARDFEDACPARADDRLVGSAFSAAGAG